MPKIENGTVAEYIAVQMGLFAKYGDDLQETDLLREFRRLEKRDRREAKRILDGAKKQIGE